MLVLMLVLALCGCKSKEVKNVEAMIDAIGTVDEDSIGEIEEAMEAYDDLSEEDKAKVENYADLTSAHDDWLELLVMGAWVDESTYYYDLEEMYKRVTVTLNEDMTADGEYIFGDWRVEDGKILIDNGEVEYMYHIYQEDDEVCIGSINSKMIRKEKHTALLDAMFVTVELTEENIADYCQLIKYKENEKDAFGTETGNTTTYLRLESTVFEDGLVYYRSSDDLAVELLIPKHKVKYTTNGKKWYSYSKDASSEAIQYGLYDAWGIYLGYEYATGQASEDQIDLEKISFGRVKGKVTFIRGEFIKEIKCDDNGTSRLLVLHDGTELYSGTWKEGMNY